MLTAREHAETIGLALRHWHDVVVVGGQSPPKLGPKVTALTGRAYQLARLLRSERAELALSHGSYAQALAAARLRIPLVTMMDYEHQPANHLSFRLARRVIVPTYFPTSRLRRCGAGPSKVLRYDGFKEELYLAGFRPDPAIVETLGLDRERVIAVFREPPRGALYHPARTDTSKRSSMPPHATRTFSLCSSRAAATVYPAMEGGEGSSSRRGRSTRTHSSSPPT